MKLLSKTLLPVPTRSCHASTLCTVPGGEGFSLLAAWFGGHHESADDVEIWLSRGEADGNGHFTRWSDPVQMSRTTDEACWNPVLWSDPRTGGRDVTLFFKRGKNIAPWKSFVRRSHDGGITWDEERELCPGDETGGRGPVKDKPLLLRDGTLLAGASHESPDGTVWRAFFDRSEDGGYTWERTDYLETEQPVRLIQPTLWEDERGIHALMRSDSGFLWRTDSADGGKSWCRAYPTALPNNNSGVDLTALPDGRLALCSNPVGSDWGARTPLTLSVSRDGGESWMRELDFVRGPGEYSYPAVIFAGDRLLCTFTWRRERIMAAEVSV